MVLGKRNIISLALLLLSVSYGMSQSLWDSSFDGYISGSDAIGVGSTIIVYLDNKTSLSFAASRVDSKRISIELTGGEGDLFAFLPTGTSSTNESLTGESEVTISATIATRVVGIDASGSLLLQGQSSLRSDSRTETIEITGVVDPALVLEGNRISSSSMADLSIVFTTLLELDTPVLTADDLVREVSPIAVDIAETATDPAIESAPSADADETLAISGERREELLLVYINRLVDLILSGRE